MPTNFFLTYQADNYPISREEKEITTWLENIGAQDGHDVPVVMSKKFYIQDEASDAGIDTDVCLSVSTLADEEVLALYRDLMIKNNEQPSTRYYFNKEGEYKKTIVIPKSFVIQREVVEDRGREMVVPSDMTPEDFEIVGSVLNGIKTKLVAALGKNPEKPVEPQV